MRWISCIISLAMIIGLVPIGNIDVQAKDKKVEKTEGREVLNMNQSWGFYRGDLEGAWKVDFDDSSFANVTVPHTMRLEKNIVMEETQLIKELAGIDDTLTLKSRGKERKFL